MSDTGPGIDPATLGRIFEPYFTTKKVGEGTGMGLAVVHGIVKEAHGMVKVKSILGKGTVFSIYLPVAGTGPFTSEEKTSAPLPAGKENILVIDDEAVIVNFEKTLLENLGYTVTAKTSSLEALSLFLTDPQAFDLVISDQTMPNLPGTELIVRILEVRPDMPVILCTGYSSIVDADKARAIGVKAFINKPLDRQKIATTVRDVLDSNSSE